jgi:hypothetical protein
MSAKRRWNDLPVNTRRAIVIGATVDTALKAAALADLVRRPTWEVRGSKPVWAAALVVVNSAGILPIAYFAWGRQAQVAE